MTILKVFNQKTGLYIVDIRTRDNEYNNIYLTFWMVN